MKKIMGYYFLLLSAIIGAGLITGQEIVSFFGGFNLKTCFAIAFSCVIIGLLIYKSLCVSESKFYCKLKNNKFYKIFVCISCLVVAGAMVAGVTEFTIRTNLPQILGVVVLIASAIFGGKFSQFFKKFSKVICILILISFIYVVISTGLNGQLTQVKGTHTLVKCFCYASFNVFLLLPLAEESGAKLTKRERKILAIILSLTLCAYLIAGCYATSFVGGGMPLITAASKLKGFYYVYIIMAFLAILTTLFSCLYSLKQICGKNILLYILFVFIVFVVSLFGFESIIEYFYLIIGVIGSFVLFFA